MEIGSDNAMLHVVEGKLARLTHDVPTLRMERSPMAMHEHVVGVSLSWLRLLQKVSRAVLCYCEAVEAAVADEAEGIP